MMFLQPWVLFGLPLVLLPIAIHLLNQRRHQPIDWGAMHFLRQASRMHQGAARVRYWLILLVRLVAVACILFFLSRPLATGWFGWNVNSASQVIVILDRSPSMEMTDSTNGLSKRASALAKLDAMLASIGNRSERILIVSPDKPPLRIPADVKLQDVVESQATDVSARMPELIEMALRYIQNEGLGPTDVWCCSDMQAHDWDTDSGAWSTIRNSLAAAPFVRLTTLLYPDHEDFNAAVRVSRTTLRKSKESAELRIDFSVRQTSGAIVPRTIPVEIRVGDHRVVTEVDLNGRETIRNGFVVPIDIAIESGAGIIELPSDANGADNTFHFAFAKPTPLRTVIVAEDEKISAVLNLMASTPPSRQQPMECEVLSNQDVADLNLERVGLLIWQAPLPNDKIEDQVRAFVNSGRSAIFFPPIGDANGSSGYSFLGLRWQAWSEQDPEFVKLARWRKETDLLRHSDSGETLPIGELQVRRVCNLEGNGVTWLASTSNGTPFLSRVGSEKGSVYFCSTLPTAEYSSLTEDGIVLYAMIQRALAEGSNSIGGVQAIVAGEMTPLDIADWERLDRGEQTIVSEERSNHSAVYRQANRLVTINRSEGEDDPAVVDDATMQSLFSGSSIRTIHDQIESNTDLAREIWRWFAIAVVLALLAESMLTLPSRSTSRALSTGIEVR